MQGFVFMVSNSPEKALADFDRRCGPADPQSVETRLKRGRPLFMADDKLRKQSTTLLNASRPLRALPARTQIGLRSK